MKAYIVKVKDAAKNETEINRIVDTLIKDEIEAINAYKAAIVQLPQFKEQLEHILKEEIEHKQMLELLKR